MRGHPHSIRVLLGEYHALIQGMREIIEMLNAAGDTDNVIHLARQLNEADRERMDVMAAIRILRRVQEARPAADAA